MIYLNLFLLIFSSTIFPWWAALIIVFFTGSLIEQSSWRSFYAGFISVFLLWIALAYYRDLQAGGLVGERMAELFQLPWTFLFYLITAVIGGLLAGLAALMGQQVRRLTQLR